MTTNESEGAASDASSKRCPNCGATEFGSFEVWDGWHVYPEHDSDCDGSCREGRCPVPIQCGPLPLSVEATQGESDV